MIETIVLAAGKSSRMDGFKPLLPWSDITIIEKVIDTAKKVSDKVIVVVGFNKELIIEKIQAIRNVEIIVNNDFENGMFSSIMKGVESISGDRFFISLGEIFASFNFNNDANWIFLSSAGSHANWPEDGLRITCSDSKEQNPSKNYILELINSK